MWIGAPYKRSGFDVRARRRRQAAHAVRAYCLQYLSLASTLMGNLIYRGALTAPGEILRAD